MKKDWNSPEIVNLSIGLTENNGNAFGNTTDKVNNGNDNGNGNGYKNNGLGLGLSNGNGVAHGNGVGQGSFDDLNSPS